MAQLLYLIFIQYNSVLYKIKHMINIIVLSYKRLPQAALNSFASTVYQKMTDDAQFVGLKSWVDALKIANDEFTTALANALRGNEAQTIAKNKCWDVVIKCLDKLAYEVNGLADGDEEIAKAAGFDVRKAPKEIKEVAIPTNLVALNLNDKTGAVSLSWNCDSTGVVQYAVEYQIQGETTWHNGTYSTSKSVVLMGIEPRSFLLVKIRSLGRKELKSDWTPPVGVLVS